MIVSSAGVRVIIVLKIWKEKEQRREKPAHDPGNRPLLLLLVLQLNQPAPGCNERNKNKKKMADTGEEEKNVRQMC